MKDSEHAWMHRHLSESSPSLTHKGARESERARERQREATQHKQWLREGGGWRGGAAHALQPHARSNDVVLKVEDEH